MGRRSAGFAFVALALPAALALPPGLAGQSVCRSRDRHAERLEAEIRRLAALAGGTVGVAAYHIETDRGVCVNGGERFPMASTFKLPIAVRLLERVDRGEVRLDSMIALQPGDLHPGSGTIRELLDDPGVSLSVRNLLELTLLISDNSATDVVLRVAGGPEAVTARMRALGVAGIRVDRPTLRSIADWLGMSDSIAERDFSMERFQRVAQALPQAWRDSAAAAFDRDPRDTATPEAMAQLLVKLWRGEALSAGSSDLLLDIMRRSTTGPGRLRGMLTPDAQVAHKTGTIGGSVNDVGIVPLPQNGGHVVIVVFIKSSAASLEDRERAIAHIARAAHDYFLFAAGN